MSYFQNVHAISKTRFWVNNVTRAQARLAIKAGAVGCTQNPAYLSKVIGSKDDGAWIDGMIDELLPVYADDNALLAELQRRVIAGICREFMPIYKESDGQNGLVSIQADPFHEDVGTILDNAERSRALLPNFLIKIPATKSGIEAIALLIPQRVPLLATEVMSMDQVIELLELHRRLTQGMENPAPFIFAHINGIFDEHLEATAKQQHIDVSAEALRCASFALARQMQSLMAERGYTASYLAGGARGLHHFTDMVGVEGGVTINWTGAADKLIELDEQPDDRFAKPIPQHLIDELMAKLPDFRRACTPGSLAAEDYEHFGPVVRFRDAFEEGWAMALDYVARKRPK